MNIENELLNVYSKDTALSCHSFDKLVLESDKSDLVYCYWDNFVMMLSSKNSYVRMRGLSLISINVKWDNGNKIKLTLPYFLDKLNDSKPIVIRVCLKRLSEIIINSPESIPQIKRSLVSMDLSTIKDSMKKVIIEDREKLLNSITNLEGNT